jgi:LysM repeat protein
VARILAVLAVVSAAIVVVVLVSSSLGGGSDEQSSTPHHAQAQKKKQNQPKYYVVQPGDTFAGIAEKEGFSVTALEKLNPNLDTQLLQEKGCINLVPEGCKVLANANGG